MNYSFNAFQEPRGVMRILQLIFAICAFATTANYSNNIDIKCGDGTPNTTTIDYPFRFGYQICPSHVLTADVSTDAQFFVATGVLSLLYCIFIIAVYAFLDELYKTKTEIPLADFMLTTVLAIFWLSGSAAWANGTSGLKTVTDRDFLQKVCTTTTPDFRCDVSVSSFSGLNISLIFGFLNFFLWASDLWFLYKETIWFQMRGANANDGGMGQVSTPNQSAMQ